MRAKIPQLREALASRFTIEHHGVMVAQLLAHIDALDVALQYLTERIELVLAPHQGSSMQKPGIASVRPWFCSAGRRALFSLRVEDWFGHPDAGSLKPCVGYCATYPSRSWYPSA